MKPEEAAYILDQKTTREALRPYLYDPERRIKVVEEACRVAVAALRPVSRERVEKVWRGEWKHYLPPLGSGDVQCRCTRCGMTPDSAAPFCA